MSTDDELPVPASPGSIEEQAAALFLRHQHADCSPEECAELDSWLRVPAHRRAFRKVQQAWRSIEPHAASPALLVLREESLQRWGRRGALPSWFRPGAPAWRWAAAAAIILMIAALPGYLLRSREVSYHTTFGHRRIIQLPDHSQIALDQGTALRVRMTRDSRVVDLLDGQAQFLVAHDPHRPFLVQAGASTIAAVGTSFNVEYVDQRMKLDMVEGRVVVAIATTASSQPPDAQRATVDLSAGEELDVERGGGAQIVHNADVAAAIAWRQGRIIFKNTPLAEAIRRLNRYSRIQLRISDPSLSAERINGVFELGDALVFADAIQSTLGVQARRTSPDELVLSPAP
ncbi:MAG TPA: FecR domain-containing protein [Steroidobacteraceae bacterium]|nr:FecR domain-containing protein [Steroidobacteraceae bacterium]